MSISNSPAEPGTAVGLNTPADLNTAAVPSARSATAVGARPAADEVLVEIVRSGFVEGVHRGRLVLLAADGSIQLALGDIGAPLLPRSSNKPMQAVGLLDAGFEAPRELLALSAASHAGEPFHVDAVRRILGAAGLDESALRTPPALPKDDQANFAHQCRGGGPLPIFSDCSGKHAAMLSACVRNGWDIEDYLDPRHQVQQIIRTAVERLAGEEIAFDAVDGCGAPLLGISLIGLARAFRACVTAEPGSGPRRVADAMRAHPEYIAGNRQVDTRVMRAVAGLIAKTGAEAVHAAALPDGRALAFKISDGCKRAKPAILAEALRRLGVRSEALDRLGTVPLLGGGAVVGGVRPADW
jgi:L-asparaginase II